MTTEEKLDVAVNALKEITKKEGPFSRDPHEHAENTINAMAEIAEEALKQIE